MLVLLGGGGGGGESMARGPLNEALLCNNIINLDILSLFLFTFFLSLYPLPCSFPACYIAEPNPPTGLSLDVDGLALVATWTEPFSLEGEDLSYVITSMNRGNVVEDGVTVNTTRYILSEPVGERDCSEYVFTIFSENSFSKSRNAITGRANIPTGT